MRTLVEALIGGIIGAALLVMTVAGLSTLLGFRHPISQAHAALAAVRTWDYQLQNLDKDLPKLAQSDVDLLVVDYARSAQPRMIALAPADVARLQRRPDGSRRTVLAYLSIGEAEEYRYYWQQAWKQQPPPWIIAENCRWPRNHLVRFWEPGWREIIFAGPDSYLARILAAGFDGVYLDRIDVYWDLKDRHPTSEQQMVSFLVDLAAAARTIRPDALIVAQNAEGLLSHARYRSAIDALAKEDLLHGVGGTGVRNEPSLVAWSLSQIAKLQREGKPVFAVEYLTSPQAVSETRGELARQNIVGVFPPRLLDGTDPFASKNAPSYGSPEYGAAKCDGVWKRAG